MALIRCSECGSQVSNKAEKCPSCGVAIAELKGARKEFNNLALGCLVLLLFLFLLFGGIYVIR